MGGLGLCLLDCALWTAQGTYYVRGLNKTLDKTYECLILDHLDILNSLKGFNLCRRCFWEPILSHSS
ncbi:hypothetical protein CR513_53423, partial [Mucuna pruriens]